MDFLANGRGGKVGDARNLERRCST
jgi:hypothetical protein